MSQSQPVDGSGRAVEPVAEPTAWGMRTAVWVVTSLVVVLPVLLCAYALVWFSPGIFADGATCDVAMQPSCRPGHGLGAWVTACIASLGSAVLLGLAWWRIPQARQWWPWPVAAVGLVAVALAAATRL